MSETWKDIVGYEGIYEINNNGVVRNKKYNRIMNHVIYPAGYHKVRLSKEGKSKGYFVHRLVAQSFIPNPYNLQCINHKDEDPQNNSVTNLEWCDHKYNNNYGNHNIKVSNSNTNNPKRSKIVMQYSLNDEFIKEWESINEVTRQLGYFQSNICNASNGKNKTAYGYIWKTKQ